MRMLNFAANTGRMYTKEEVLERFGVFQNLQIVPHRGDEVLCDHVGVGQDHHGRGKSLQLGSFGLGLAEAEEQQGRNQTKGTHSQSNRKGREDDLACAVAANGAHHG